MTTTLEASGLGSGNSKRLKLLIWGPPKSGKTVYAHQMPATRTLDFNDGMQSVEWAVRAGIISRELSEIAFTTLLPPVTKKKPTGSNVLQRGIDQVETWILEEDIDPKDWDRPYSQLWDTLIIDSGSDLTREAILVGLAENQRLGISKSLERTRDSGVLPMRMQDWGSANLVFNKFINYCLGYGKNVVLICHEYVNSSEDGTVLSMDPKLIGQARQDIPGHFDEVWYATVAGTREKPKFRIQTSQDSVKRLGSRLGCLDPIEEGDFPALKKKIAKFYGLKPDELWTTPHGTEAVKAWQEQQDEAEGASI